MTRSQYLIHLTLDTGHSRRSYRSEVRDDVIATIGQQLTAPSGTRIEIIPGYTLARNVAGAALSAMVMSDRYGPLVTIAVVARSRESAKTWQNLIEQYGATGDPPSPPWCAVKIHPTATLDLEALGWLGDYERCLAWAWIERGGAGAAGVEKEV